MKSLLATAAVLALCAGAAQAVDLQPFVVYAATGDYIGGDNPPDYNQFLTTFGSISATNGASVAVSGSPGGSVFASSGGYSTVAGATLSYYGEVVGPAHTSVVVGLDYRLFVQNIAPGSYHNGSAEVDLEGASDHLYTGNYSTATYESCTGGCVTPGYISTTVTTDTPFLIALSVNAEGAEAYADPKLVIDPTWKATNHTLANQLSLSFSSGITNALGNLPLGVPEPGTWSLMLVGFAMLGGGLRLRARRTASV